MFRILICDDEGIVRESLRYMIDKSFGKDCEVELAKNGCTAIELAETFVPDIILMDIQMPGINGIKAMEEIQKENKNIIFIVLTAYDKFEYSQKSIDIGVMSYLTKPINKDTLTDTLRRAMKTIAVRREKKHKELKIKEKLETVSPMIEQGYVYSVMLEDGSGDTGEAYRNLLGIEEKYGYAIVIECGDELRKGKLTNAVGAGIKLQKHYMFFSEIVKETIGGVIGALMVNKIVIIVPVVQGKEQYEERVSKIDQIRSMLRKLERQTGLAFKGGIGQIEAWEKMGKSYRAAVEAVRQGIGRVVHIRDMPEKDVYEESYPAELEKELFHAVEKGNETEAKRLGNEFFVWMKMTETELTYNVRLKTMEFVLWAEHIAYLNSNWGYRFNAREGYLELLMAFQNYEEIEGWFLKKIGEAARYIDLKKQECSCDVVEKAKQYIKARFREGVSLEKTAREVGISPYYLSKLFKETEGSSYIDYLTALRIDYAKENLADREKSIKEICAGSGYREPNYFSRIFKKWTGLTPTEYRESLDRKDMKDEDR